MSFPLKYRMYDIWIENATDYCRGSIKNTIDSFQAGSIL